MTAILSKHAVKLLEAIDAGLLAVAPQPPRQYIGGSSVGHDCDALLSLSLRGFPDNQIDPQLQRIFELGHLLEDVLVAHIKKSNFFNVLHELDPKTGDQWEYKSHGGHYSSHFDGIAEDKKLGKIVFEAKSMNKAKFEQFKRLGVQYSHPLYFFQCQGYMNLSGLKYAVIIAYCKDNSQIHAEFLKFDPVYANWITARVDDIVANGGERIAYDSIEFRCKGCFKHDACWGKVEPEVKCVTCRHATPDLQHTDKRWHCMMYDKPCDQPCSAYVQYLPRDKR